MLHFAVLLRKNLQSLILSILVVECIALPAHAQSPYTYNLYGVPGLIDMPTAQSANPNELATTISTFEGQARTTLTFQITPRLSGSFRYGTVNNTGTFGDGRLWDRSFDLRYRLADEGRYRPAIAIGLQDFIGTGVFSGEYIVATKTFNNRFAVTGGIGWGRLGSYNSFQNPFGSRFNTRSGFSGRGGEANLGDLFRGPAALFGGVSWAATDRLTLLAEYSSDAYTYESNLSLPEDQFNHRSPINVGLNYQYRPGVNLSASYLYGSVFAVGATFSLNPGRTSNVNGRFEPAPLPVAPRPARHISPGDWGTGWLGDQERETNIETALAQVLAAEGMTLEALSLTGTTARVRLRNERFDALPEAIGRTARILTHVLPASVEVFDIEPVIEGIPTTRTRLRRSDLEDLENAPDSTWLSYARADIAPVSDGLAPRAGLYPRFTAGLAPFTESSFFDPDQPVRLGIGAELSGRFDIAPGLSLSGSVRQRIAGNLDGSPVSFSALPRVRTDAALYAAVDEPYINHLTLDYFFRPGTNLYGRLSAGYLEQMYAGVSGEILWQRNNSPLALGAEINYVQQRDFNQQFGLRDYDVITGHASAYYDFGNGFVGQIDAGRYLAGDWGATFRLNREFRNGWRLGAYFTLTDVSFDDFGEGSFDKGLELEIPISWALGQPTRQNINLNIHPITRDGGARLNIRNRLYNQVRESNETQLRNEWGLFWR
ncbi:YjbH domain-containing protein [Cochlodiniinecator piscidefendens]|uniref:YjbH domain-containing protein n=1 Tax=Cochlodiniinecator piscidefendens TaxID=2715756 RepID=UPI002F3EA52B